MCRLTNFRNFRDTTRIDKISIWDGSVVFKIIEKTKKNAKTNMNLTCDNFRSAYNIAILDNMIVSTSMNDRFV